jgi:sugar fermentation stimulation protein A
VKNELLRIPGGQQASFLIRRNRFLLSAETPSGETVDVHVPDPGRLKELLFPGNDLLILPVSSPGPRKTRWSLLAARDSTGWILVNTSFHRRLSEELFKSPFSPFGQATSIQAEVNAPSGTSRLDFHINGNIWVEVKGCTLKAGDVAMFPDAPTSRGLKHILELTHLAESGIPAAVVFLVFVRKVLFFTANRNTDPKFALALQKAVEKGVQVFPVQLSFDGCSIQYKGLLELRQDPSDECPQQNP